MGATTFMTVVSGNSAKEAFDTAVADAQYDYGHAGYTGTIAEKTSFVEIRVPDGVDASAYADQLIEACDPRVDDKWGDAGCFNLGDNNYMFFGWASC